MTSASATTEARQWRVFAVLLSAGVMDLLDTTVVNVAVPSIRRSFDASLAEVQWMIAGYMLAFGLGLITGGRLGDLRGRRRVFLGGVAGFTLASLAAGIATSAAWLIAARVLQGIAAAIMVPQILAIAHVLFPPEERGKAYGLYGAVTGLAAVIGPLLAGVLLQFDPLQLGWRTIFLINVPVGIVAFVLGARMIPESRAEHRQLFDVRGVVLSTAALVGLLIPLVQGRELGWPPWMLALAVASVPMFAWFIRHERRYGLSGGSPLVPLRLFAERGFSAGLATCAIFFSTMGGFFLTLTITLQLGLHASPLATGLTLIPFSVAAAVGSGASIALTKRYGRYAVQAGVVVLGIGFAAMALALEARGEAISLGALLAPLAVSGLGMGIVIAPLIEIILAGVDHQDAGAASGVLNATGQIGQAIGVAVLGSMYFTTLGTPTAAGATHALSLTLRVAIVVLAICILAMLRLPVRVRQSE